ncbi:MAG: hypothetical protein HY898_03110 [Deltaproteobacteria bacterium]|nr:hypothetical protein [Deltaproteobacteria bacterium]
MHVPTLVLARPGAAATVAGARMIGVGFMHHAKRIDTPEPAQPRALLSNPWRAHGWRISL